jgi:hypothetical protein
METETFSRDGLGDQLGVRRDRTPSVVVISDDDAADYDWRGDGPLVGGGSERALLQ